MTPVKKHVTIRDVAAACGYSVYTVSSVLNDKGDISERTAVKVREVIRELNYDPLKNLPGNHLTRPALCMVMPDIFSQSNSFFHRAVVTASHEASLRELDYMLLTESDLLRYLDHPRARGQLSRIQLVIVYCAHGDYQAYIPRLLDLGLPVALVRRPMEPLPGMVVMPADDYAGAAALIEHLVKHHDPMKIGWLGPPSERAGGSNNNPRFRARQDVLARCGLDMNPDLHLHLNRRAESRASLVERIMDLAHSGAMTVLQCWTDDGAATIAAELLARGVRIPLDLGLAGFDDDEIASRFYPGITTVHVPVDGMLTEACVRLLDRDRRLPIEGATVHLPLRVVVRQSCCPGHDPFPQESLSPRQAVQAELS